MAKTSFFTKLINRRNKTRVASDGLLSDQETLNLGSLFEIKPKPDGLTGLNKFGDPVRILNIEGSDADSETVLITLQNETVFLNQTAMPVPGPVVGIVEFGTGSGFARIEFDIPSPVGGPAPNQPSGGTSDIFVPQKNNVVTLCLPASSIRVFARNDAQIGMLNAFNTTTVNVNNASRNTPAMIRCHAAYGKSNMVRERVTRQYYIAGTAGPSLGVTSIIIGLPAFAKRVSFPRVPVSQTIDVSFGSYYDSGGVGPFTIPADDFTFYDIPPHTSTISIANPGPAALTQLSALFELGF